MEDSNTVIKPAGRLWSATFLCAGCGGLLAIVISLSGVLNTSKTKLTDYFIDGGFYESELLQIGAKGELIIACGLAVLTSFFVLDSKGSLRRVCIGFGISVLLVSAVLPLVLWGVIFLPFYPLIAILVAWVAAFVYASQHTMRCDVSQGAVVNQPKTSLQEEETQTEKTIEEVEKEQKVEEQKKSELVILVPKGEKIETNPALKIESELEVKQKSKTEAEEISTSQLEKTKPLTRVPVPMKKDYDEKSESNSDTMTAKIVASASKENGVPQITIPVYRKAKKSEDKVEIKLKDKSNA